MKIFSSFLVLTVCFMSAAIGQSALNQLLNTPFVSSLTVSPTHSDVYFVANEQGLRHIYRASAPNYDLKKLTNFVDDDGLEITSLSVSPDGEWITFVRGGEHSGNSSVRPINPRSNVERQQILVYVLHLPSETLRVIGEGDYPFFHPSSTSLQFMRSGQVWNIELSKSDSRPNQLFHTSGSVNNPQWCPKGEKLLFSASRGGHAFIGIFHSSNPTLQWVSPSFHRDRHPQWSPDGSSVAFIRTRASGGAIDLLLSPKHQPWSIMVSSVEGGEAQAIWTAPTTLPGSVPSWQGTFNLKWNLPQTITFLSYQDGWPHLYSIQPEGSGFTQLTKGNFTVDQMAYSSNGRYISFAANTGSEKEDLDRKHIGIVDLQNQEMRMLTSGAGIEAYPMFLNNDKSIAYLSSTLQRPYIPKIMSLTTPKNQRLVGESMFAAFDYSNHVVPKQVSFSSEDGLIVYGQLYTPKNATTASPALVYVHGGPRRQMFLGWHFLDYYFYDYMVNQHLAQQGFVVLAINYRMGTGYGYDFQSPPNAGTQGASEYLDILASGKWLQQQANVDPGRIGVFGGSYGGYLTAMALARNSDIFKAGVDIHGVHNRSRRAPSGESPADFVEAAQLAWESSPSRYVDTWQSPVLIVHSDDDQNVDFAQSIDLYNRLTDRGVETEILVIPDDTHHWMVFANLVKVKEATVKFLEKHLLTN